MRLICRIFLFFTIILLAGCSSAIKRYGYDLQDMPNKDKYSNCIIPIKKDFQYNKDEVEILGSIKAGDTLFSVQCGEVYVLNIFQEEACALGADLINITFERRMDIWSSCYRATAEFLRLKDKEKVKNLVSDPVYVR